MHAAKKYDDGDNGDESNKKNSNNNNNNNMYMYIKTLHHLMELHFKSDAL